MKSPSQTPTSTSPSLKSYPDTPITYSSPILQNQQCSFSHLLTPI